MAETLTQPVVVYNDYPVGKFATKYAFWISNHGLSLIAGWRQAGATIEEIYNKIGVDPRTFRAWRNKYPALEDALVVSKEISDLRVVNALYQRAIGYDYDEITQELVEGEMRTTKVVRKHMPPDVKAILAYLYNRRSNEWRAYREPSPDKDAPDVVVELLAAIRERANECQPDSV